MKLIKPSFEMLEQKPGLEGIYEAIETAGRLCYKSTRPEGKTAKDFVDMLIARKHYAMLEHGTVYLKTTKSEVVNKYTVDPGGYNSPYPYVRVNIPPSNHGSFTYYITTNYRFLLEHDWLDDLQYLCEPTEFHEKRIIVHFTCDRGVSHEFVRHRTFSFAMESSRYCNYSKDKFGNEITFIIPSWLDDWMSEGSYKFNDAYVDQKWVGPDNTEVCYEWLDPEEHAIYPSNEKHYFMKSLEDSEKTYLKLIELGWKPQQARQVLPNALKTELVMTGFVSDWEHFFSLRARETTGKAHPDAKALAEPLMQEFAKRSYIK